ncbi:hypothetical protein GOP47_0018018 [Adiantum capillus-veneris]|uniref:Cation/H+ exchanger domain-containing protein n=1 Tax=Adiantum capillus-veneris TaxID=13818 RepID=A0A9D4UGK3_ADICA|nr:hypothetical protein GOP47_0018018 [Adiantum capillus-veneris]
MVHNATAPCFPVREAVSNGVLQGDNPLKFALPLLIIQTTVVLLVTRTMAWLFKPFRQPRVLAEIIGGVLLGPTGLGRSKTYLNALFPKSSLTLLDTIATVGLLFFLFMVGLELDLKEIRKSGKLAFLIAIAGIALPFMGGVGIASLIHETMSVGAKFAPLVVFMGVPISITAFPVLMRIMAEIKLLSTDLAKMVIPAAAINDVCAWILLAIGVAISGPSGSPVTPAYVLLWGAGFVLFMLFIVKRVMEKIADRVNGREDVSEICVCVTMMGVLLAAFSTDAIGIHPLFGAFVFGLIVPKEGHFAQMLIEKIEDFVTVLMLPLFFASSGLKTNLGTINSARTVGFLVLLVLNAAVGKILGTVMVALAIKLPVQEAFALGFLMNTKGLVELIVLNIGKDIGVFDDQTFAVLVLMCLLLMFFTTPAVKALYKPARAPVPYTHRKLEGVKKDQLRILACVHGTRSIPAILNLVEACKGASKKKPLKLFAVHMVELTERTSSMLTLSRSRKLDGKKHSGSVNGDNILVAFEAYGRIAKVPVRLLSIVSELDNMHYDVWNSAAEKRATIIIVPYSSHQKEDGTIEYVNPEFRAVNQRVMQNAPCSVGVLVDRGLWGEEQLMETTIPHKVAVLFFGGADDREALAFGLRLAEHPNVTLWVLRLVLNPEGSSGQLSHSAINIDEIPLDEEKLDEETLAFVKPFKVEGEETIKKGQSIYYEEHMYESPIDQSVLAIAKSGGFSLFLVGRGHNSKDIIGVLPTTTHHHVERQPESSDLGLVGDALASACSDLKASILVIKQHNSSNKLYE